MTFSLNWTTQENQISSRQYLIPDITFINLVLKHLKILLNLPNVQSCIIKITATQNKFVKNILYFILSTDKKLPRLTLKYYNLMINRTSWHDSCIALVSSPRHSYRTLPYIVSHPSNRIISYSLRSCDMMSEGCDTIHGRVRYECLGLDTSAIQESCHDIL